MPKIDITEPEQKLLLQALETETKSAKRAQNTGKNPEIIAVWERHEQELLKLNAKIYGAK